MSNSRRNGAFPGPRILGLALVAGICSLGFASLSIEGAGSRQTPLVPTEKGKTQAPVKGTPDEIERYKNELTQRLKRDRANAKRGDVLTPELTSFLKNRFQEMTQGKDGAKILALIQESNPGELPLQINGNYPKDGVLATMPPAVLQGFPELPEGIEYRFVGCRLMLMAQDSRVIIDYTEECFF